MHTRVQINIATLIAVPLPSHSAAKLPRALSTLHPICMWLLLIPTDCTLSIPLTSLHVTSQTVEYYMGRGAVNSQKDKEIMGWRARLLPPLTSSPMSCQPLLQMRVDQYSYALGGTMIRPSHVMSPPPSYIAYSLHLYSVGKFIKASAERSLSI